MIEKANRLGEGAKQPISPTNGQASPRGDGPMISQQLKRELYKRKNSPGEIARNAALVSSSLQPDQHKKLQIFDSYDMAIGKPRKNMAKVSIDQLKAIRAANAEKFRLRREQTAVTYMEIQKQRELEKGQVDKREARHGSVDPAAARYTRLCDENISADARSKNIVGLSHKYSHSITKSKGARNLANAKVFPSFGLAGN